MPKVLLLNGSPKANGCTATALQEMIRVFEAEGIETEEMAGAMKDISCDYLQGYYFSRPVPMDEFVKMSA